MTKKNLDTTQRNQIVQYVLQKSIDGKPKRGTISAAVVKFSSSRRTIHRLWAAAKKQYEKGEVIHSQSTKFKVKRKKKHHLDLNFVASLDIFKRSSQRMLAEQLKCSKTTVGRWIAQGLIRAHTSTIKPDLTAPNKLLRLRFSLQSVELDRVLHILKFKSMNNTVHIDEKWFYISKKTHKFYLGRNEVDPHRTCKSKNFITKIMFMCAVCRTLFADDGTILFDGKIGIFPFTQLVPAKRNSKNRIAGTLETKPIESVTKLVIKECLINQIILAIMSKWPAFASKTIFIQQDNARPHIKDNDPEFRDAASSNGFNIKLVQQPPNSPDTNINDLGWFRTLESEQTKTRCRTVDDLVNAVLTSFRNLCPKKLNKVFLSLQGCMVEIMKIKGKNSYKVPHFKKDALERQHMLPVDLEVSEELVRACISYLISCGSAEGIEQLMEDLDMHVTQGQ